MEVKTYILSGGKSARMGEDKGLKPIIGKPAIRYLLDTLININIHPAIIAHHHGYHQLGVKVIGDVIGEKGPMGGIYTALQDAGADVLILAADVPFLSAPVIRQLLENREAHHITVIRHNGRVQPLCGVYPVACEQEVASRIRSSALKMMDLLEGFPTQYIDINGQTNIFHNINTPADGILAEQYLLHMKIKCFGKLTDIVQEPPVPAYPLSVAALQAFLLERFPALAGVAYKVAVNQQLAGDPGTIITESDEIALLPAYSGG